MTTPARHRLTAPREVLLQSVARKAELLEQRLGGAEWNGARLAIASATAFTNGALRACLDTSDPAILSDLELCACAAAGAHLAAFTPGSEPIEVSAPGGRRVVVTRANGAPERLDPPLHWRTGLLSAVVARNHAAMRALTQIEVSTLVAASHSHPEWFPSEAAALAAAFQREPSAGDLLVAAMRAADPERVNPVSRDWVLDVVVPEVELAFRALQHDASAFDSVMRQALDGHHHYYGHAGLGHSDGQLALAPLAMACMAHDIGVHTTLRSDYTPRWIIERAAQL
jgi:hypothetical protein